MTAFLALFLAACATSESNKTTIDSVDSDTEDTAAGTDQTDTGIVDSDTAAETDTDTDTAQPVCDGVLVFSVNPASPTRVDPSLPQVFIASAVAVGGDVTVDKVEMAVSGPTDWLAELSSLDAGIQYIDPDGFSNFYGFGPSSTTNAVYDEANGRVVWTVTDLLRLVSSDPVEVAPLTVLEDETFVFVLYIYGASSVTGVIPEVLDGTCQEGVQGPEVSW